MWSNHSERKKVKGKLDGIVHVHHQTKQEQTRKVPHSEIEMRDYVM